MTMVPTSNPSPKSTCHQAANSFRVSETDVGYPELVSPSIAFSARELGIVVTRLSGGSRQGQVDSRSQLQAPGLHSTADSPYRLDGLAPWRRRPGRSPATVKDSVSAKLALSALSCQVSATKFTSTGPTTKSPVNGSGRSCHRPAWAYHSIPRCPRRHLRASTHRHRLTRVQATTACIGKGHIDVT